MIQSAINSVVGNVANTAFQLSLLSQQKATRSLVDRVSVVEKTQDKLKDLKEGVWAKPTDAMTSDLPSVENLDLSKINKNRAKGGEK